MVLFVTCMLVDLSVTIKQVTVSVAVMELEVSGAHMHAGDSYSGAFISLLINFCCG